MRDIASLDAYRLPAHRTHADAPEPLWREALGERLRAHRRDRGTTLAQTADRAGVSPQYLSEMERGLKEPSSEMIAAVAGALGLSLPDLVGDVARHIAPLRVTEAERPPAPTRVPVAPEVPTAPPSSTAPATPQLLAA